MDFSENWYRFCKSEDEYFTCRYKMMEDEKVMVNDLRKALLSVNQRETALRLLAETKLKITSVIQLLSMIVDAAVDSSHLNEISLSREILFIHKDELQAREIIRTTASNYLNSNDEWHFRRTAELYKLLGYEVELANLLALCQTSPDVEIRELCKDYGS